MLNMLFSFIQIKKDNHKLLKHTEELNCVNRIHI